MSITDKEKAAIKEQVNSYTDEEKSLLREVLEVKATKTSTDPDVNDSIINLQGDMKAVKEALSILAEGRETGEKKSLLDKLGSLLSTND